MVKWTSFLPRSLQGGKTHWVTRLLALNNVTPIPEKIIVIYHHESPSYNALASRNNKIKLIKGLPDSLERCIGNRSMKRCLIILDDLMSEVNEDIMNLFIRGRHLNISVIFIVHNLFYSSKFMRTISLNTHYLCIFKNPADKLQLQLLGRRMYPGKSNFFLEAFARATEKDYGYLFWDGKPTTNNKLRLRTSVLKEEPDTFNRVFVITDKMEEFTLVPLHTFKLMEAKIKTIAKQTQVTAVEFSAIDKQNDGSSNPPKKHKSEK